MARFPERLIASLAAAGLLLQLGILVGAAWGRGESGWGAAANCFSYFTILTNLLVALAFGLPAAWARSALVRGGLTLHIGVVGLVYELALRRLWHPEGLQFLADLLLHDAVPLSVIAWWLLKRRRGALAWPDALWWLLYPAAYLAFALWRGFSSGWWAYPFLNAASLGAPRVALNAGLLVLLFTGLGLGLVAWDRRGHPPRL